MTSPKPATPQALVSRYLGAYPATLQAQALALLNDNALLPWLRQRHPQAHTLRTDSALYTHVMALKAEHLRSSGPLSKAVYDPQLKVLQHALGTHTTVSRVQGGRLKAKQEIRVAALFKHTPLGFLNMICAHELAHMREREHNKAFYQLCEHIEPDYHRLELELRLYLCHLDWDGRPVWTAESTTPDQGRAAAGSRPGIPQGTSDRA